MCVHIRGCGPVKNPKTERSTFSNRSRRGNRKKHTHKPIPIISTHNNTHYTPITLISIYTKIHIQGNLHTQTRKLTEVKQAPTGTYKTNADI